MLPEKEKLEEELKLLEESYSLDVITRDEYEEAKQRIDDKLKQIEEKELESKEAIEEGKKEEELLPKEEEESVEKEQPEQKEERKDIVEEEKIKTAEETAKEEVIKAVKAEEKVEEEKEEVVPKLGEKMEEIFDGISNKKLYLYIAIVVVTALVLYFFFFVNKDYDEFFSPNLEAINLIGCVSDDNCIKGGIMGKCINVGNQNAKCEYIEDAKVGLIILNGNECFNCKTDRILKILNSFFPNMGSKEVDFESEEGKNIAQDYNINALPAYIFDENIKEAANYEKFSMALIRINGNYVMKSAVANSNYYLKREEISNKLDLIIKPGQEASQKAEDNVKDFLEAFRGKVNFEKHNENSKLAKELGINAFPTFLVNNKIKFDGVHSANNVKENFCEMNKLEECSLDLSKSLV